MYIYHFTKLEIQRQTSLMFLVEFGHNYDTLVRLHLGASGPWSQVTSWVITLAVPLGTVPKLGFMNH